MKPHTIVIYHHADFDGIFCREIARKFLPQAELIGWDYGEPEPVVPPGTELYILDLSVPGLMDHPQLIWIDHHASAIAKYHALTPGYRIDGVAACRLAWQWFTHVNSSPDHVLWDMPDKAAYVNRLVREPLAVRLAGEYDVWDQRDPRAGVFQFGLRAAEIMAGEWYEMLDDDNYSAGVQRVEWLLERGSVVQGYQQRMDAEIIRAKGFTIRWHGLLLLCCNAARYNSHLFTAGLRPEHDGCLGWHYDGRQYRVSLYGVPGKPDVDLSKIAVQYGGGGHKQACGFVLPLKALPFLDPNLRWEFARSAENIPVAKTA